jgi:hypothetical protein
MLSLLTFDPTFSLERGQGYNISSVQSSSVVDLLFVMRSPVRTCIHIRERWRGNSRHLRRNLYGSSAWISNISSELQLSCSSRGSRQTSSMSFASVRDNLHPQLHFSQPAASLFSTCARNLRPEKSTFRTRLKQSTCMAVTKRDVLSWQFRATWNCRLFFLGLFKPKSSISVRRLQECGNLLHRFRWHGGKSRRSRGE